ncbi:tRNA (adenosine(37)-N6)-threonylcarbamoyltransferase complex ATPase subunit type 1 TsaE [uncultured Actinobacillus sp.]|uniref:tRNA (adenosine(37)-N6)-threonylcarbamoyltransferase complex ATPase subunit type 1 TsaE n=1 Tax=uncultured Actinobacillus sp. TaxID=417616 RepID=UPI0025E4DFBB|nr:tRNA (adenosine(37)-N6)-threonylcarbamoyltransferase complex ATPase subunit type 1 TsaE [uncultured Actinobacillus sp.]
MTYYFPDEESMLQFGQQLASAVKEALINYPDMGVVIYLKGDLGAGKTTLTRSIVRSFGYQGNVKSPTYTLVEEYQLSPFTLYHFDLYRLADPEELEFMGIKDYFRPQTLCLLEWPSKGEGMIPEADLVLELEYANLGRNLKVLPKNSIGLQIKHSLVK